MNVQALKGNLHKQIAALQDETALLLLHDAVVDYNRFVRKDDLVVTAFATAFNWITTGKATRCSQHPANKT